MILVRYGSDSEVIDIMLLGPDVAEGTRVGKRITEKNIYKERAIDKHVAVVVKYRTLPQRYLVERDSP